MASQYRMTLRPKNDPGPVSNRVCNADEAFQVRDLTTRSCSTIQTREISLYRHAVLIEGREFQILNLVPL